MTKCIPCTHKHKKRNRFIHYRDEGGLTIRRGYCHIVTKDPYLTLDQTAVTCPHCLHSLRMGRPGLRAPGVRDEP